MIFVWHLLYYVMPYKNREKQLEAQSLHYKANRELYNTRLQQRRLERAKWWAEYKKRYKCERCGEDHPACVAFHHKNPENKRLSVAVLVASAYPVETILEEIDKCEVLCHNCHAIYHWETDDRRRNR